jgi:hypothetical protein
MCVRSCPLLFHRETIARVTGGMKVKADRDEVTQGSDDANVTL